MDSKGDVRQFFWLAFRRPFGTNPDGVCLFRMHGPRCPSEADFCFLLRVYSVAFLRGFGACADGGLLWRRRLLWRHLDVSSSQR